MADDYPPPTEPDLITFVEERLRQIGEAVIRSKRKRFRAAVDVNGLRVGLNAEPPRQKPAEDFGALPEPVRALPRAAKRIFALIRDLRATEGPDRAHLDSTEIEARIRRRCPHDDIAIDTVRHALKQLRETEEVWSHPVFGYVLGREQPSLPFDARQPGSLPDSPSRG